jgi:hypothetical protein
MAPISRVSAQRAVQSKTVAEADASALRLCTLSTGEDRIKTN